MKPKPANRLALLALATLLGASVQSASAAALYWNPVPLSNSWDASSTFWSATSGGSPTSAWVASSDAVFDRSGAYTVNLAVAQTAGAVIVSNGTVTFSGSAVSANSVSIAAGSTLNTTGDRIAKSGTTAVTVDGTLDLTAGGFSGGHYIQLGGGGTVIGGFRHSGDAVFAGNLQDVSVSNRAAILWNGGTGGTLALSGNNSGMTGDVILGVANSVVKLNSANALGSSTYLRFESGAGANLVELAAADFTRASSATSNSTSNGGLNWAGTNAGFYATGADRNLTLVTIPGGATPASLIWGTNGLTASTVVLGAPAATNTLTWTNDIDLNLATRTINVGDGSADVDAALSGVLSGTGVSKLNKSGAGVLLLSNANTFAGGVSIADSQTTQNPLRISNAAALGTGTLTIGGGGNNDKSRLEVIGGITITNTIAGMASRATTAPNFINLGGNNTITSSISSGAGGAQATFQSDAGTLTLSGAINARQVNLTGAGNGVFSNNTFNLGTNNVTKSGTGTWVLKGTAAYSGTTTVSEGSLVAQKTTQLALGTGNVAISGGANLTIQDHAGGGQLAYANNFTVEGSGVNGGGVLGFYNSGAFDLSGTVAISNGATFRTDPVNQNFTINFTNVISGTDGLTFFAQGSTTGGVPRFTLTGASTYSGDTTLTSSGLNTAPFRLTVSGGDDRLPTGTQVIFGGAPAGSPAGTFNKSVTLALDGVSQQIAGLVTANSPAAAGGYRIIGASTTASTLVVNNPSAVAFSGVIGGTGTNENNIGLTKTGAGTLTLTGANTYAGPTLVTGGTLSLSSASLDDASAVTVATGAFLNLAYSGTDVVASLKLGGVPKPSGIYDSTNSGGRITGSGKIQVVGAVANSYSTWADSFTSPPLSDKSSGADPDNDGLTNLVEYALGSDPRVSNPSAGTLSGGTLSFTKGSEAFANGDITYEIEQSTNLGGWSVVVPNAPLQPSISYVLPTGQSKEFARLKITRIP